MKEAYLSPLRWLLLELATFAPVKFRYESVPDRYTDYYDSNYASKPTSAVGGRWLLAVHWYPENSAHVLDVSGDKETMREVQAFAEANEVMVTQKITAQGEVRFWLSPVPFGGSGMVTSRGPRMLPGTIGVQGATGPEGPQGIP